MPTAVSVQRQQFSITPTGVFLSEAFNIAGGNRYHEPRSQWINFLDRYTKSDYYLGTSFDYWLYSASPRGDVWQVDEGYGSYLVDGGGSYTDGGLNSTGFIWHAAAKSLSEGSGLDISVTGKWVPMLNGFNNAGFSRQCWTGGNNRWYDFIKTYNVKYYEFSTKSEMLSSGVLTKGDIIWTVDGAVGTLMNGLSIPADNHHVGIYMGDGSTDSWWQTGPTTGDGDYSAQYNSINPIYGCAARNTYIVLPWDGVSGWQPAVTTTTTSAPQQPITTTSTSTVYRERSTRTATLGLKNPSGGYFNDAIKAASGGQTSISLSQWQSFITEYASNDYYIGTPLLHMALCHIPKGRQVAVRRGVQGHYRKHGRLRYRRWSQLYGFRMACTRQRNIRKNRLYYQLCRYTGAFQQHLQYTVHQKVMERRKRLALLPQHLQHQVL